MCVNAPPISWNHFRILSPTSFELRRSRVRIWLPDSVRS
jgi:hypothetical protein